MLPCISLLLPFSQLMCFVSENRNVLLATGVSRVAQRQAPSALRLVGVPFFVVCQIVV